MKHREPSPVANAGHYAKWLNRELNPDVYAVLHLKQAIRADKTGGWIRGSETIYQGVVDQFIRRLSKRVYGNRIYRRHKKLIPNMATLEGNPKEGMRYHVNIAIKMPPWIDFTEFEALALSMWTEMRWAMSDRNFLQKSTGNCIAYSLKNGPEALLVNSLSF